MTDEEYVKMCIQYVKELFNKERGREANAKKLNLGDIIATKIETPIILHQHFLQLDQLSNLQDDTQIYGNIKAMIPLFREKLVFEANENAYIKGRYKRELQTPLREKRIFGVLTKNQVGYIPNVDICFTDDEQTFLRDTYIFKSLISKKIYQKDSTELGLPENIETVEFSQSKEIFKATLLADYSKEALKDEQHDQFVRVGTLNQIETFHRYLMSDLFREEKPINFQKAWV